MRACSTVDGVVVPAQKSGSETEHEALIVFVIGNHEVGLDRWRVHGQEGRRGQARSVALESDIAAWIKHEVNPGFEVVSGVRARLAQYRLVFQIMCESGMKAIDGEGSGLVMACRHGVRYRHGV